MLLTHSKLLLLLLLLLLLILILIIIRKLTLYKSLCCCCGLRLHYLLLLVCVKIGRLIIIWLVANRMRCSAARCQFILAWTYHILLLIVIDSRINIIDINISQVFTVNISITRISLYLFLYYKFFWFTLITISHAWIKLIKIFYNLMIILVCIY